MDRTADALEINIEDLTERVAEAGEFIKSITDDCFEGPVVDKATQKVVAETPTELADEILDTAKQLKRYAIEYEALTKVDDDAWQIKQNETAKEGE